MADRWVSEQTRGKIAGMGLQSLPALTQGRAILLSAIHFEGRWEHPFFGGGTRSRPFTRTDGKVSEVPTMVVEASLLYVENDALQAVSLPYGNGGVVMTIFLPRATNGLAEIEAMMAGRRPAHLPQPGPAYDVTVYLPRFRIASDLRPMDALVNAGLKFARDPDHADFSAMSDDPAFRLRNIVQKAVIQVDEEGTTASAADAVEFVYLGVDDSPPQPERIFRADRPFFFIVHTDLPFVPLFAGRVTAPE